MLVLFTTYIHPFCVSKDGFRNYRILFLLTYYINPYICIYIGQIICEHIYVCILINLMHKHANWPDHLRGNKNPKSIFLPHLLPWIHLRQWWLRMCDVTGSSRKGKSLVLVPIITAHYTSVRIHLAKKRLFLGVATKWGGFLPVNTTILEGPLECMHQTPIGLIIHHPFVQRWRHLFGAI